MPQTIDDIFDPYPLPIVGNTCVVGIKIELIKKIGATYVEGTVESINDEGLTLDAGIKTGPYGQYLGSIEKTYFKAEDLRLHSGYIT